MDWKTNIVTFLSATGIINSLFLAVFLFFKKSRNVLSNKILSFILLIIALKFGYASIEQQLWSTPYMYYLYTKISVTAYLCLVPLFLFYIQSLVNKDFRYESKQLLFFIPALLYALNPFEDFFWYHYGFYFIQLSFIAFSSMSIYKLYQLWQQNREPLQLINKKILYWLATIQLGIVLVFITAFGAFIYELATFYALVVYFLIKVVIGDFKTLCIGWQNRTDSISQNEFILKLQCMMENEKLYLNPSLTLPKLAQRLSVSLHTLSREINSFYSQNFTEYINSYRIEEARRMLSNELFDHLTIESIAYDCGFNSLSSFNSAFKKQLNLTPSQYRLANKQKVSISLN